MRKLTPIERGRTYHIYNRGTNGENIFIESQNYNYFLKRWQELIEPVTETFAYCLLRNHFHFLLKVKDEVVKITDPDTKKEKELNPSKQFSNFFNSYAQSINTAYKRTGSLFEHPFRRIEVTNDQYFSRLIAYIHFNPQKHCFVDDYRDYPYSSYNSFLSNKTTRLKREKVLNWFGNKKDYMDFHN